MDIKDIEEELKKRKGELKMKDFDSRWVAISERMEKQTVKQKVYVEQPVIQAVNGKSAVSPQRISSRVIICSLAAFFILIALAIVLVYNITNRRDVVYGMERDDLSIKIVSETDFYIEVSNLNETLINLQLLEIYSYSLAVDADMNIWGGVVQFNSLNEGYMGTITFYSEQVTGIETVTGEEYDANGTTVNYVTQSEDGLYTTSASANYNDVNYLIEYSSYADNAGDFFDMLFA